MDKPKEGGTVAHDVTSEGKKESKQRSQARNEGGGRGHHGQGDQRQSRNWKGGNNWHRKGSQRPPKKHVSAEALSLESILAREDKPIVFDLTRDKLELNEWFKSYAPSKIRRSDGIGWIMVLSEHISQDEKKFLFEREKNHMALNEEWRKLTTEKDNIVTFQTIQDLALKHDCKGGKWICHPSGSQLDELWQRTVLALAYGKLAEGVIGIKISPINDLDIPGGNFRGGAHANDHVLCVINRDMTNTEQVLNIEKTLRSIPIKFDMQYKPNIYSQLGIYRNNKYKLRPTIYSSSKDSSDETHGYKIENVVDQKWTYSCDDDVQNNNLTIEDVKEKLLNIRTALSQVCEDMAKIEAKDADVESTNQATKLYPDKEKTEKSAEDIASVSEKVKEEPKKESVKSVPSLDIEEIDVKTDENIKSHPDNIALKNIEKSGEDIMCLSEEVKGEPKKESVKDVSKPDAEEIDVKTDENIKSHPYNIALKNTEKSGEDIMCVSKKVKGEPKKESVKGVSKPEAEEIDEKADENIKIVVEMKKDCAKDDIYVSQNDEQPKQDPEKKEIQD